MCWQIQMLPNVIFGCSELNNSVKCEYLSNGIPLSTLSSDITLNDFILKQKMCEMSLIHPKYVLILHND